jgi:hypothetical protein
VYLYSDDDAVVRDGRQNHGDSLRVVELYIAGEAARQNSASRHRAPGHVAVDSLTGVERSVRERPEHQQTYNDKHGKKNVMSRF